MNARGVWGVLTVALVGLGGVWLVGSCGGSSDASFTNADGSAEAAGDGPANGGDGGLGDGGNPPGCPATQPSGACSGQKSGCTYGCESCFCQSGQWQCSAPGCAGGCFPTPPTAGTQCGGCCGPSVGMSCDYGCAGDAGTFRATCVGTSGLSGTWTVGACAAGGSNPGKVTCGAAECDLDAGQECCDTVTNDAGVQKCGFSGAGSFCMLGAPEACDEKADCTGANICCMQFLPLGIETSCLPTCITGAERYQACKTSAECESGTGPCATYTCKNGETVQSCTKPVECK